MALTTINSGGVKDDSIVNADIKSDAAIAGTKVAPDFGSQAVATTGTVKVGGTDGTLGLLLEYSQSGSTTGKITSNPTYTNTSASLHLSVDGDANANQLVLKGDGKIGIGTSVPDNLLHLYESSTTQTADTESQLVIEKNSNSGITILSGYTSNGRILFGDSGDNDIGQIDYDHNNNSMTFVTAASAALTIDDDQNVGIVTTETTGYSNHANLFLGGTSNFQNPKTASAGDWLQISQNAFVDADGSWEYRVTDEATNIYLQDGKIGFRTAASGTAGTDITWAAPLLIQSDKVMFSTHAKVETNDDYDLGANGARWRDLYLSGDVKLADTKGIDFSASEGGSGTSNENSLLNDYETGQWTPTANSGCDGLTYTAANCVYTKIGKQVTLHGKVKNFTNVDGNILELGGLPFVAVEHVVGSCMVHSFNINTTRTNDSTQLNTFLAGSSVQAIRFYLSGLDGNDAWTAINGTKATNNGDVYFTVSYWVA